VSSDLDEFGDLFTRFRRRMMERDLARPEGSAFGVILRDHLGAEPASLQVLTEAVPSWHHANLQLGLDALLAAPGREHVLYGISAAHKRHMSVSLADIVDGRTFRVGAPERLAQPIGPDATLGCLVYALVALRGPEGPSALLVRPGEPHGIQAGDLIVEAIAPEPTIAERVLAELREHMRRLDVYRGQVISFAAEIYESTRVTFLERPRLPREDVILAAGVLDRVERHVVGIGELRESLLAAGRHLKRGLLLHGPPGTGKTHTVRYLMGTMTGATVIVLSGSSLGRAGAAIRLARDLAPALVVLEDVDLVAEARDMGEGAAPLLFELMNEMEGMADDADVAFVLTTNRADLLEPALAARPGRVDLAVEIPLPAPDERRRLLALYGVGLDLALDDPEAVVAGTDGVTASFIRELLRKAAVIAALAGATRVQDRHVAEALAELSHETSALTRSLLGGGEAWRKASAGWLEAFEDDDGSGGGFTRHVGDYD
jgi:ATPase family associated with various cellular activities (AAA)